MTIEGFKRRVEEDSQWAPGWEIIDKELRYINGYTTALFRKGKR